MDATPDLSLVLKAALAVQDFCETNSWPYCFIGGLAYQIWGYPRSTMDADLTLLTEFVRDEDYVDKLLARFESRRPDGREFALKYRVVLLWSDERVAIDIGLGALPFEANSIRRSVKRAIAPNVLLRVCSPEDLIVHKAFATREQDWADVDNVLLRQGRGLDCAQIFEELRPLVALKEDDSILPRLEGMMRKRGIL
ncbi:MAG TPA: nucleotidyl transferase AbiEii/AbiGii toxin family protein [Chthoniobacterales bacterium]